MSDDALNVQHPTTTARRWQPLSAIDRRVLGVLAEKAKTTPDIYPMSLNAICTGCNQKSNREPLMQLEAEVVEESLDRLRPLGAVGLIEGYGRVAKYRHYLYEWLGVEKVEMAVMTELLLRGDQTVGELRGRASRMEPIPDLAALQPILESLKAKGLMVSLTPEGRGHVVSHALYKPRELEILRAKYSGAAAAGFSADEGMTPAPSAAPHPAAPTAVRAAVSPPANRDGARSNTESIEPIRREIEELRRQTAQLRHDLDESLAAQEHLRDELRMLKDALGG